MVCSFTLKQYFFNINHFNFWIPWTKNVDGNSKFHISVMIFFKKSNFWRQLIKYFKKRNFPSIKFSRNFNFAGFLSIFGISRDFIFAGQPKYYILRYFNFAVWPKHYNSQHFTLVIVLKIKIMCMSFQHFRHFGKRMKVNCKV